MTSVSYAREQFLKKLQPTSFQDLIGQQELTSRLRRLIYRARNHNQPFPPVLLVGQAEVGKFDIASAMAYELADGQNQSVHFVVADELNLADDFKRLVARLDGGDVVVVERLHRLDLAVSDGLAQAAAGVSTTIQRSDNGGGKLEVDAAPFSLLATATTRDFVDSSANWNPVRVRDYNTEELVAIAHWCADRFDIELTDTAAFRLARYSHGYVRRMKSMFVDVFLDSVESLSQKDSWLIDEELVEQTLE